MGWVSLVDGHIDNAEHCIHCGEVIPEGIGLSCPNCESKESEEKSYDSRKQRTYKQSHGNR